MNQWLIMGIVAGGVITLFAVVLGTGPKGTPRAPGTPAGAPRPGAAPRPAAKGPKGACGSCKRAMLPAWTQCPFCGWQPGPAVAKLQFIHGPIAGTTIELHADVTTLGSIDGNTIVLADPGVSRKHAGIRRDAGGYEVADLGSTNGIYVNGHRVPKHRLAPGDIIRIGGTEAVFHA
jgi:hypothetical protein